MLGRTRISGYVFARLGVSEACLLTVLQRAVHFLTEATADPPPETPNEATRADLFTDPVLRQQAQKLALGERGSQPESSAAKRRKRNDSELNTPVELAAQLCRLINLDIGGPMDELESRILSVYLKGCPII